MVLSENILFNLPLDEGRYQKTLEVSTIAFCIRRNFSTDVIYQVCALVNDLKILEDGDESEIGERGVG